MSCQVRNETTQAYAKVVDRIRENPTKYLEELMGGANGLVLQPRLANEHSETSASSVEPPVEEWAYDG